MQHLPLFADLKDRACLVIGGGGVAERRVLLLLEAGARVSVIAHELTSETLRALAADGRFTFEVGTFETQSLEPYWLIVAATGDRELNMRVARAAEVQKRFCNVVDNAELCSFIMPAIIDRAPVTIAIGSGGHSPVLSRWIKGLIETSLPSRLGAFADLAGRWRGRVREALPKTADRRHFWEHLVQSEVAEHSFAGRDADAELCLQKELTNWNTSGAEQRGGEAYLVGAGPGSPDLITLRGRQLLAAADVVLYDRLVSAQLLAFARRDAELVSVGKTPGRPSITQKQLNRLLVRLVKSGKRVCRLKGGDPMIFGRGGEELEELANAGLRFQVVPGVSAVEGCAAYAGIPLTLRGVSQAVLLTTGQTEDQSATALAEFHPGQTLAIYMGVAQYAEISAELIGYGHDPRTPVAIVESGTTDGQRVIRTVLGSLARAQAALDIRPPALLLVGETTRFAERYSWFAPGRLEKFEDESERTLARVSY
ncbi:MAG TPA: siroheme synthase CysG [Gammaproteobacteria bacterium]|nr:siroheme synthase CysG [Gammaproteobacteria bacterium]